MRGAYHPRLAPRVITSIEAVYLSRPGRGNPWVIKAETGFTPGPVCIPGLCSAGAQAPPPPISTYAPATVPEDRLLSGF